MISRIITYAVAAIMGGGLAIATHEPRSATNNPSTPEWKFVTTCDAGDYLYDTHGNIVGTPQCCTREMNRGEKEPTS
jgi:hypothetical protein